MPNSPTQPPQRKTFTGVARRSTRRSVKVIDFIAKYVITIGGIGVTVFFAAIILFLFSVVVPLFRSAEVTKRISVDIPASTQPTTGPVAKPVAIEIEESLKSLWLLDTVGNLTTFRVDGAEIVSSQSLSTDQPVTAVGNSHGVVAIGRADGTVKLGSIKFESAFVDGVPDVMESLNRGETVEYDGGVAINFGGSQQ